MQPSSVIQTQFLSVQDVAGLLNRVGTATALRHTLRTGQCEQTTRTPCQGSLLQAPSPRSMLAAQPAAA